LAKTEMMEVYSDSSALKIDEKWWRKWKPFWI